MKFEGFVNVNEIKNVEAYHITHSDYVSEILENGMMGSTSNLDGTINSEKSSSPEAICFAYPSLEAAINEADMFFGGLDGAARILKIEAKKAYKATHEETESNEVLIQLSEITNIEEVEI